MKLYFAAGGFTELLLKLGAKNILESYFYIKSSGKDLNLIFNSNDTTSFFLDSGAFSAKNSGKIVSLSSYIEFIKKYKPILYAGLDVIGDAVASKHNIEQMEKEGLNPIPTFHRGSKLDFLFEMVDKYDYIALGGIAITGLSQLQKLHHLDRVWSEILKRKPNLKVHGFGCSGFTIMKCYPWYSVDSTSWIAPVKFNRDIDGEECSEILRIAQLDNIELNYDKKQQREILLRKSLEYFISLETDINKAHSKSSFERTSQLSFF